MDIDFQNRTRKIWKAMEPYGLDNWEAMALARVEGIEALLENKSLPRNTRKRPNPPAKNVGGEIFAYKAALGEYVGSWVKLPADINISASGLEAVADYCEKKAEKPKKNLNTTRIFSEK